MDLLKLCRHRIRTVLALLAVAGSAGRMYALSPTLTLSANTVSISCNTSTGPGPAATIIVKLSTSPSAPVTIGTGSFAPNPSPVLVTLPSPATLTTATNAAGLSVTINAQPGCANASSLSSTATFHFTATGVAGIMDAAVTVNLAVTAGPSILVASPSAITVMCVDDGKTPPVPGQPQLISITSPAPSGTSFTVDTVTSPPPTWATLSSTSGGTATMAPVSFTVVAKAGCGGYLLGSSHTGTIHLKNGMAQDKVISVTLLIASPSPLVLNQPPAPLSYIKGSGIPGYTDVYVTAGPGMYFTVDTSSLPVWLTVDATAGTSFRDLRFSSTVMAESMPPGSYSATVRLQVSGYGDLEVILTMQVSNPAATLTVVEGPTRNYTWSIGQPAWTPFVTLKSSGSPIPYSIQSGGALAPIVDPKLINGLAYNFGTTIPVTFASSALAGVPVGGVLSGTLSIISGNPASTYVVTFTITVQAPGATLSGISPTTVPTSVAGSAIQVVLIGTGFVSSLDPSLKTKVGVVIGNTVTMNTNFATTVLNPSNLLLTITVPSTPDPLLPFALGGTVILGICNPIRGACSVPTGVVTLNIGASPLIQAVTSASTYVQAVTYPPAAPYDMLAIFGTNLCATCVGTNAIMNGAPLPPTLGYPTSLSNTDAQNITRTLKVTFKQHAATTAPTVTLAGPAITQTDAPLLFATNTQINLLVPQAVKDAVGQGNQLVDLVVTYGNAGNVATSAPYTLIAVPSNPGVFTINSDGRGDAAVLDSNYLVVGPGNPGAMRDSTVAPSDTVMIYMTGLGLPSAGADNANAGGGAYPADCISTDSYLTALSGLTGVNLTAVDGLIIQSTLVNTKRLVPCLSAALKPQVRIGGVICPVSYAGWVPDSIAGLYQVNVTLPGTTGTFYPDWPALTNPITDITGWTVLPVEVKSYDNVLSQTGVTIVVAPR